MENFMNIGIDQVMIGKIVWSVIILVSTIIIVAVMNAIVKRWRSKVLKILHVGSTKKDSSLETQLTIIRRLVMAGIYFFALILIMLQFDAARSIGTGLLASAGVAGLIIGMAAQTTFANVIAGIVVAFSQPVKLNDAVIFEGDYGTIEEISLMHTIIKTWDNRRIVVPNGILANKVIQNWTMKDPSLLGTVTIYTDYHCDVEQVRKWFVEIAKASEFICLDMEPGLQVVDLTEKAMVLRGLAKAKDAPAAWDLRCEIRENLIKKFKEANLPMPLIRIEEQGK